MIIKLSIISITLLAIIALSFSCRDHHGGMMSTNGMVENAILRVYPADGSADVPTSTTVAVKFTKKMDSVSVMNNLHIVVGGEMYDWMDSIDHHGGMGHMSMDDMDYMMDWMDSIEMAGTLRWNDAMDSCEFIPSSGMHINQEHMIFMDEGEMMEHSGGMMGSNYKDDQFRYYHFTTGE